MVGSRSIYSSCHHKSMADILQSKSLASFVINIDSIFMLQPLGLKQC